MESIEDRAIRKYDFVVKATACLLFLNTFFIEAIFRTRDFADKSMDFQVILKTVLWVITFIFCVSVSRLWIKKLLRIDNFFQMLLLAVIFISCTYAPNPFYSLGSAFSLVTVIFLLLLSSVVLDNRGIIRQIILGCTLVTALSIIVYFAFPDFGRMKEWDGAFHVTGKRLTGITGSANTAGYIAAICLLALYYYRLYLPRPLPLTYWLCVVINLAALLMSDSRTSIIALVVSIGIAGIICNPTPARLAALCFGVCLAIIGLFTLDLDAMFSLLARSGNASEIETGTGRTLIWKVVIELIREKPLLGWGYSSSVALLPDRTKGIQDIVTSAHNVVLQILLSVGFVGLFFFAVLMLLKTAFAIRSRNPLNIAFIFFLLIDGLTEAVAFQGVATTSTLILATVLALNYKDEKAAAAGAYNGAYVQRDPATGIATYEVWRKDGKPHRADGPAIIERDGVTGIVIRESWCKDGKLHRTDGPAHIERDSTTGASRSESWYEADKPIPQQAIDSAS
jgi:O-antigen ligase